MNSMPMKTDDSRCKNLCQSQREIKTLPFIIVAGTCVTQSGISRTLFSNMTDKCKSGLLVSVSPSVPRTINPPRLFPLAASWMEFTMSST
jgi:hypothetical protein